MSESSETETAETRNDDAERELQQLLEIARIKRSKVKNLRPLKELALMKAADSDECSKTSPSPYQFLSPLLRKEILQHMAAQQGSNIKETPAMVPMSNWMLELTSRVLNSSIKEFDFNIFGSRFQLDNKRDLKVWKMLVESCPNLELISDKRRPFQGRRNSNKHFVREVMPFLKSFSKLEHIVLPGYICESEDLAQLARHFPKLQTLSTTFELVHLSTMINLFRLQNLKRLDIDLNNCVTDEEQEELMRYVQLYFYLQFQAQCMEHLPCLQYCSGGSHYHNDPPYQGNKLSLKEMNIIGDFNFELAPFLEKLQVSGHGLNLENFGSLSNLTTLILYEVYDTDISAVLTRCGERLRELEILGGSRSLETGLDPYEVVVKCPKLRNLKLTGALSNLGNVFFKSQLNANLVKHMQHFQFTLYRKEAIFPPDLMALVLAAPDLKTLEVQPFNIFPEDLINLTQQLLQGHILQKLGSFKLDYLKEEPNFCTEFLKFLCLLPVHAPRLKCIKCESVSDEFEKQWEKSFLSDPLQKIDGFHFHMGYYEYRSKCC